MLLAEACNTGFEPLIRRDTPALRRSRLKPLNADDGGAEIVQHPRIRSPLPLRHHSRLPRPLRSRDKNVK